MSEHGFHVHGPHDHELEHAAHSPVASFAGQLAVVTALLATLGALFSYMSGATESEAMLLGNDAAVRRTEANSHWNDHLNASGQQRLAQLASEFVPDSRREALLTEAKRQGDAMAAAKRHAERLDAEAIELDARSDQELHRHHRWAQATTVLQISIAMAAIALLTRRRWLLFGVFGLGLLGAGIGIAAWFHL